MSYRWLEEDEIGYHLPGPNSTPAAKPVSYAQALLTFLIVYPPPPSRSRGLLKDLTNLTQLACPEIV